MPEDFFFWSLISSCCPQTMDMALAKAAEGGHLAVVTQLADLGADATIDDNVSTLATV